jgi:2-aminoethylphosphonate-pyruvate transaminase
MGFGGAAPACDATNPPMCFDWRARRDADSAKETEMPANVPLILTPGPVVTAREVKEAMLFDYAPADDFIRTSTANIRDYLVGLVNGKGTYECVPLQGSGTYATEAAFHTLLPPDAKMLIVVNGFYGLRLKQLCDRMKKSSLLLELPMLPPPTARDIEAALDANPGITHLALCHCETATGVLNPIVEIATVAKARGVRVILDAIASFGAFDLDAPALDLEAIIVSSNKGLESVPGIAFVIAKRASLEAAAGNSISLCLDLHAQWTHMEKTGQWRYTPPTHVIAALATAIRIHQDEGGIRGRHTRFHRVWHRLVTAMRQRRFETLIPDDYASPIVTTFLEPADTRYSFSRFSAEMRKRGFIVFPGRLTASRTFRIGCMGRITDADVDGLVDAIEGAMQSLGVQDRAPDRSGAAEGTAALRT